MMAFAQYDVCLSLSFAPYDIWSSCHLIYVYDIWLSRHMLNMMFVCQCHLLYMRFGHHGICSIWYLDIIAFAQYDVWLSWYWALFDIWLSWHWARYGICSKWKLIVTANAHLLQMSFDHHGICSKWYLVIPAVA